MIIFVWKKVRCFVDMVLLNPLLKLVVKIEI
jgi:hypothetical protein